MTAFISVIAASYLAIAYDAARRHTVPAAAGARAQARALGLVLAAGLCWPREYWALLRRDWDNHFLD